LPTILQIGPYRFFFYSADGGEPPHVHVERDDAIAKFWLSPVRLAKSGGLRPSEIRSVEALVAENVVRLVEAWNEYFGT
jgi:hypothetical protein